MTDAGFISLLLALHDDTRSPLPVPRLEAEGDMSREDKRYQRVRVCCGLTGTPAPFDPFRLSEAPLAGYQLPHSIWTRRKSHSNRHHAIRSVL
ncbi:MAG: hypothetical protein LBD08_03720 [Treponema sp.]|nr:hypothetical protein [Treponema sp.]